MGPVTCGVMVVDCTGSINMYYNSDKDDNLAELLRVIVVNYTIYGSDWVEVSVPGTTSPWYLATYYLATYYLLVAKH